MKERVSWLQFSDLHIFYSVEWTLMEKAYEALARAFKPDFIVITGDYCNFNSKKSLMFPHLNF